MALTPAQRARIRAEKKRAAERGDGPDEFKYHAYGAPGSEKPEPLDAMHERIMGKDKWQQKLAEEGRVSEPEADS